MKYCKDCNHAERQFVMQGNKSGHVWLCKHPDMGDAVSGEPMPCVVNRNEERLCGFEAKGWVCKVSILGANDKGTPRTA